MRLGASAVGIIPQKLPLSGREDSILVVAWFTRVRASRVSVMETGSDFTGFTNRVNQLDSNMEGQLGKRPAIFFLHTVRLRVVQVSLPSWSQEIKKGSSAEDPYSGDLRGRLTLKPTIVLRESPDMFC